MGKFRVEYGFGTDFQSVNDWAPIDPDIDVFDAESAKEAAENASLIEGLENARFRVYELTRGPLGVGKFKPKDIDKPEYFLFGTGLENEFRYEIKKDTVKIPYEERENIKPGCSYYYQSDAEPESIISVYDRNEAEEFLHEQCISGIYEYNKSESDAERFYIVEEYYIEENEYDSEGNLVNSSVSDLYYSKMEILLVAGPGYRELGRFDNMLDAEKAMNEYNERGISDVHLSLPSWSSNIVLDGTECVKVNEWENGNQTYTVGKVVDEDLIEDSDLYIVEVSGADIERNDVSSLSGKAYFEFDHEPDVGEAIDKYWAYYREPAQALMEKYGFESPDFENVDGNPVPMYGAWASSSIDILNSEEGLHLLFSDYKDIKTFFEGIDRLVENNSIEQLQNRQDHDEDLEDRLQVRLALAAKEEEFEQSLESRQYDMSMREPALALMEKYGYELVEEQDEEHFFNIIRSLEDEKSFGFDGWGMIADHFETVDKLVADFSIEQLQARLNGDFSVIEYGIADDDQIQIAIKTKTLELQEHEQKGETMNLDSAEEVLGQEMKKVFQELEERPIVKLTGLPVSDEMMDILHSLKAGEYVDIDRIKNTVEMKTAYSHINYARPTVDLPGREAEQAKNINDMLKMGSAEVDNDGKVSYTGDVSKSSRLDIVIGLPASGKSSAIVDTISNEFHSRVIDNDEAKKMIPEFNNGWGAGIVHEESKLIADTAFDIAVLHGDNIVLPKVGSNAKKLLQDYVEPAVARGYSVNLHYVDLDRNKALARMLNRFFTEGRFLDPELIDKYCNELDGNKIERCYNDLKDAEVIQGYSLWDNDVKYGERPILVEYNNLEGNYISTARKEPEMDNNMMKEVNDYGRNLSGTERGTADLRDDRESGRSISKSSRSNGEGELGYSEHGSRENAEEAQKVLSDTAGGEIRQETDHGNELLEKQKEYNPLAKIEELEEGNYNMIDGIPNNGFGEKKQKEALQFTLKEMQDDLAEKKSHEAVQAKRDPVQSRDQNIGIDD